MRRILLIENDLILDAGVAAVLGRGSDLEILRVPYIDETTFLQQMLAVQPDVIVLNEAWPPRLAPIVESLCNVPALTQIRIVMYRLDDNRVIVCDLQNIELTNSEDLLRLVRSESVSIDSSIKLAMPKVEHKRARIDVL